MLKIKIKTSLTNYSNQQFYFILADEKIAIERKENLFAVKIIKLSKLSKLSKFTKF